MTANRAASIRARLKQHADASKQDFNPILTRYGLERALAHFKQRTRTLTLDDRAGRATMPSDFWNGV